jgi:hypothetical protein
MDRVTIDAPAEAYLIQIAFLGHTRRGKAPTASKQDDGRAKRSAKKP